MRCHKLGLRSMSNLRKNTKQPTLVTWNQNLPRNCPATPGQSTPGPSHPHQGAHPTVEGRFPKQIAGESRPLSHLHEVSAGSDWRHLDTFISARPCSAVLIDLLRLSGATAEVRSSRMQKGSYWRHESLFRTSSQRCPVRSFRSRKRVAIKSWAYASRAGFP
jgi:hypothetical protein